jgi:protein-S-isoprenylcysteine O-methyltransferase Ste14
MTCGNCGSDNLTRLSLLWERGTAVTTSAGFAMTASGQSASVLTRNVSQTHAAVSASPPKKKHIVVWMILWFVYVLFPVLFGLPLRGSREGVTCFVIAILFQVLVWTQISRVNKWNRTTYAERLEAWQSSYQCNRCGAVGVPS